MKARVPVLGRPAFLVAALLSVPLAGYTAWLAYDASQTAARVANAAELPPEDGGMRRNGEFYRVSGPATATWLAPDGWAEGAGAIAYRIRHEMRGDDGQWRQDASPAVGGILEEVDIAGVPVIVGKWARLILPWTMATRDDGATARFTMAARIGKGKDLVAWGAYQHGRLVDSATERLVIGVKGSEADIYEQLRREGLFKTRILAVMAVVAALSGALAAWRLTAKAQRD